MRVQKALFGVILSFAVGHSYAATVIRIPKYTDVAGYSINKYPAPIEKIFDRKTSQADETVQVFYSSLSDALKAKYPAVTSKLVHKTSGQVTMAALSSSESDAQEFVIFSGRGVRDALFAYDGFVNYDETLPFTSWLNNNRTPTPLATPKRFGGWTRWVIFDADQVLNVMSADSKGIIHSNSQWLGGAHAVLGHAGDTYQFTIKQNCFYLGPIIGEKCEFIDNSSIQYKIFVDNFINKEMSIWLSYALAMGRVQYVVGKNSICPAIVYQTGYADTYKAGKITKDQPIDFSEENYRYTFDGPFDAAHGAKPDANLKTKRLQFGTPTY